MLAVMSPPSTRYIESEGMDHAVRGKPYGGDLLVLTSDMRVCSGCVRDELTSRRYSCALHMVTS